MCIQLLTRWCVKCSCFPTCICICTPTFVCNQAGREAEKNVRRVLAPVRAMMENPSYVKRLSTARSNQARRGQNSVSHSSHSSLVSRTTVPSSPPASLSPPCPLPNRVSARDVLFEGRSKRRSKRKVFLPSSSETKYRGTGGTGKAGALFSYR